MELVSVKNADLRSLQSLGILHSKQLVILISEIDHPMKIEFSDHWDTRILEFISSLFPPEFSPLGADGTCQLLLANVPAYETILKFEIVNVKRSI